MNGCKSKSKISGKMEDNVLVISDDYTLLNEKGVLKEDGFSAVKEIPKTIPQKVRTDLVIVMIVNAGYAECNINGKDYRLEPKHLLFCLPNTVFEKGNKSANFSMHCLCISVTLIKHTITFSAYNWDVLTFMINTPVLELTDNEHQRFNLFYSLMSAETDDPNRFCFKESVQSLLHAFIYDFNGVLSRYVSANMFSYTQGHNLFKSFLDLLGNTYPRPRSVSFYAERLNVSPKYLSSACKAACGNTASWLIHEAVTRDISNLLTYSNKSIKEIMVELNFPSLSFFGKYVKKHFGVGPKEYRTAQLP